MPYTRVHILWHRLASRLLNTGGTLQEVADVLRHRELDTSLIYAKVDLDRLDAVAMPWAGSRPRVWPHRCKPQWSAISKIAAAWASC